MTLVFLLYNESGRDHLSDDPVVMTSGKIALIMQARPTKYAYRIGKRSGL